MVRKYPEKHRRRTYTLYPRRNVVDHQTGFETADVEAIFDGDLDAILDAGIRCRAAIRNNKDKGPCTYCGSMYSEDESKRHFIPCWCGSMGHAGCQHP